MMEIKERLVLRARPGKLTLIRGGHVPEMLPAVVVFTGAFRVSGYQSYRTQDKKLGGQVVFSGGFPEAVLAIRGFLTLGWGMTFIAHGAFMQLTALLDSAKKQITRWQGWFMRHDVGSSTPHEQ